MIRGISHAASAMVARSRQQDVTANNLANAGTSGYKRQSLFLRRLNEASVPADKPWLQKFDEGIYTDFSQGTIEATSNPFDLAVDGEGFFVVDTPEGERYTRAGSLTRSASGELVTSNGFALSSDGGAITLPQGDLSVSETGEISVDSQVVGSIRLVQFKNPQALRPVGQTLYETSEPPEPDTTSRVRQGFLERANLDPVTEMVNMMSAFRYFETAQKAVQIQDETLGRAVNQIGKVQG
jgi:flagellar basal-body rod protein FlgF